MNLSKFPMQVSQAHASSTSNSGFFQASSNVNASHGVFNDVSGSQLNFYENRIDVDALQRAEDACLNNLRRAAGAGYRSETHNTCLRGTREWVLQEIKKWEVDTTTESVYWLKGVAGCGKSTIAQTFAEHSAANGHIVASFFCSRDFPDRRNLRLIIPTLAYDLAYRCSAFKTALVPIIRSNPNVEHEALAVQLDKLLVQPLKKTGLSHTIVVDALDECEDKEPVSAFLSALARYIEEIPTVKFFITGRPEDHIRSGFMIPSLRTKELPLHDVDSATVDLDIKSYVETKLAEIATRRKLSISGLWPSDRDIAVILKRCSGLFIVASIIIKFIDFPFDTPQNRLKLILNMPDSTIHEGESGTDVIYNQVFATSFRELGNDASRFFDQLQLVLGSIVLAFKPMSRASLAKLLELSSEVIWNILSRLHSVLIVPDSDLDPIRICHKSFADFITDSKRCPDPRYRIDAPTYHLKLGALSLKLMNATLTKNICQLPRYAMNDDIEDLPARREKYIGAPLAYACVSWAKHLRLSLEADNETDSIVELVNYMFENHFLSWLEVLSLDHEFRVTIYSLHDVRSWLASIKNPAASLLNLINDCERFVIRFFDVMEQSATHIYHSALLWSPTLSTTRKLYQSELVMEAKELNAVDTTWDAYISIILVGYSIKAVVFSDLGTLIAVRGERSVKIFDTMTGVKRATVEGEGPIYSVTFSPDDNLLAYGREDGVVCVFDLQTSNPTQTFEGHTDPVCCVAFSSCGSMIASGSYDKTIRIWSTSLNCCKCALEGFSGQVLAVCWSAAGNQVLSGSDEGVRIWDVSKRTCSKILCEHTHWVTVVACSRDLVASASFDGAVKVYNSQSGSVIQTIQTNAQIHSMRFSISGDEIIYTSGNSAYIWDLASETYVSTIEHKDQYSMISPDRTWVASISDKFVKTSRIQRGYKRQEAPRNYHPERVTDISFSQDGQLVQSLFYHANYTTAKVWDATTDVCLFTFDDMFVDVDSVVFSPNSAFVACLSTHHLMDDTQRRVQIWNVKTRILVKSIQLDSDVRHIALSPDGSRMVSLLSSYVTLWDLASENCLASSRDLYLPKTEVAFGIDGTDVLIKTGNCTKRWRIFPALPSDHNQFASLPLVLLPMPEEWSHKDEPAQYITPDEEWVLDPYGRRILWVPPDERPPLVKSNDRKIVAGTNSGKVYIIDFFTAPLSF